MDNNKEKVEANNEGGTLNELIEYCKANESLISVNVEEMEGCKKEDAYNKTIEHCKDNKDEEKIEANNEGGILNDSIEHCKDNKGLTSINTDSNVKEMEEYKKDVCDKTIEHWEDNKDEGKIEKNNEGGMLNDNIEHCKDDKGLTSVDNNVEEMEVYKKEDAYNETIEHYEDNKDLVSTDVDNVEKAEVYKEEGLHKQNIECSKENSDNNCSVNAANIEENLDIGPCTVNVSYICHELLKVYINHVESGGLYNSMNCKFIYWELVNYRRHGLFTQFFFKCQKCRYEASIWSEPIGIKTPDIVATVSVGRGIGLF